MNLQMIVIVIVAVLAGSVTAMINDRLERPPLKIAVIDPAALVAEQLKQIEPGLDDATIQNRGQTYAKRLDAAISHVAQQYNVVILVSPAVIAGAPDLTHEVRRRVHAPPTR